MDISVIIVSYNVEGIITLCIDSVMNALDEVQGEVIVVDNASSDNTVSYLRKSFEGIQLIENQENVGFAVGCHDGAAIANGRILLFLNPDVIIANDYLNTVVAEFNRHDKVGTVSPLLLDGRGEVLKETARELPSTISSIKHLLNISSKTYYQDLDVRESLNAEIISGACLAIAKKLWDEIGGFDQRYFMYAEDVDLSYQVHKKGFYNIVLVDHPVVHLKGESTRKTSWTYNRSFYKSMYLFAQKYKGELYSPLEVTIIGLVTSVISIANLLYNILKSIITPLRDLMLFTVLSFAVQQAWATVGYQNPEYYKSSATIYNYILYAGLWALGIFIKGGYFRGPRKDKNLIQGFLIGWMLSVLVYAFLPVDMRSSRMILIITGVISLVALIGRSIIKRGKNKRSIGILTRQEKMNTERLRGQLDYKGDFVMMDDKNLDHGSSELLNSIVVHVDSLMSDIPAVLRSIKRPIPIIYYSEKRNLLIYGDDAKTQSLTLDQFSFYNLVKPEYRLQKRIFDLLIGLLIMPVVMLGNITRIGIAMKNVLDVLGGSKSIIGWSDDYKEDLPKIKPSIYSIAESTNQHGLEDRIRSYAMHYSIFDDVYYLVTCFGSVVRGFGK